MQGRYAEEVLRNSKGIREVLLNSVSVDWCSFCSEHVSLAGCNAASSHCRTGRLSDISLGLSHSIAYLLHLINPSVCFNTPGFHAYLTDSLMLRWFDVQLGRSGERMQQIEREVQMSMTQHTSGHYNLRAILHRAQLAAILLVTWLMWSRVHCSVFRL